MESYIKMCSCNAIFISETLNRKAVHTRVLIPAPKERGEQLNRNMDYKENSERGGNYIFIP